MSEQMDPPTPQGEAASRASNLRRLVHDWWSAPIVFVVGVATAVMLRGAVARMTFFQDEWAFIVSRRSGGLETLMAPHNEHWVLIPSAIYRAAFEWWGLASYPALATVSVAIHVLASWLLYLVLARWTAHWIAGAIAVAFIVFGWSDEVILWPLEMSFTIPVAAGLLAVLAWDRAGAAPGRDAMGMLALLAGLASGAIAVVFVALAAALRARHRPSLTWYVWPAIPTVIFLAWVLAYRGTGGDPSDEPTLDLALLPAFVARGLTSLAGPLMGLDYRFGIVSAIAISAAVGGIVVSRRVRDPRFWIPAIALVAYLAMIGAGRLAAFGPEGAAAPRYLYAAGALAFLATGALLEAVRSWPTGPTTTSATRRRILPLGVAIWFVIAVAGGVGKTDRSILRWTERADLIRAQLGALDVLRPTISSTRGLTATIDRALYFGLQVADYYAAVDDLGPPHGATAKSLLALDPDTRAALDEMLARVMVTGLQPVATGPPPRGSASIGGRLDVVGLSVVSAVAECAELRVEGPDPSADIRLRPGEWLTVRTDGQRILEVFARVFASAYGQDFSRNVHPTPGIWYAIRPARIDGDLAWKIRVDPPPGSSRFDVCLMDPPG